MYVFIHNQMKITGTLLPFKTSKVKIIRKTLECKYFPHCDRIGQYFAYKLHLIRSYYLQSFIEIVTQTIFQKKNSKIILHKLVFLKIY